MEAIEYFKKGWLLALGLCIGLIGVIVLFMTFPILLFVAMLVVIFVFLAISCGTILDNR